MRDGVVLLDSIDMNNQCKAEVETLTFEPPTLASFLIAIYAVLLVFFF